MPDKFIRHGASVDGDGLTSALATSSTVTFDVGTDVVTWTSHTFANDDRVYFTTTGTLPTGLTANTAYFVRDQATNTFKVAATAGGAAINLTGSPSGTHTGISSGAWNTINYFDGTTASPTRGAIAAGDVIYIRSKQENGTDYTVTMTASRTFGNANGVRSNPITWIIDSGDIWSGIDGTITYEHATNSLWKFVLRDYNNYICRRQGSLVYRLTNSAGVNSSMFEPKQGRIMGMLVDWSAVTSTSTITSIAMGAEGVLENCVFKKGGMPVSGWFLASSYSSMTFKNCEFEVTGSVATNAVFVNVNGANPTAMTFIGGRLYGSAATTGLSLFAAMTSTSASQLSFIGFQYPYTVAVDFAASRHGNVLIQGADDGVGAATGQYFGTVESRDDGLYPYLNASIPNSINKGWSWKVWPRYVEKGSAATWVRHTISKLFTQDSATTKTLTLELLVSNSLLGACNKSTVWMDVSYVKRSDSLRVEETTEVFSGAGGSLDTSTADWLPNIGGVVTYGATGLNKRKLTLTTANAIKQDTLVMVTFRSTVAATAGSSTDIFFVCPDPQIA